MPVFAANLTMMFNEWSFLDRFAAAAEAGFTAVEFLFPYEHSPEAVAERLRRNGLTLALFNLPPGDWAKGERGLAALPDRFDELKTGIETAIPYAQAAGARRVHLMAGLADPRDPQAAASYRRAVAHAAGRLGEAGLDLMLEPINGRDMPGYFLNDFGLAEAAIAEIGAPNLKLQFDAYHRQIIHGDLVMGLRRLMPIVGHVQIASVPSRNEPDDEELNYRFVFDELDRLGYAGFVGCEYRPRGKTVDGLGWLKALGGGPVSGVTLGCIADDYTGASDLANTLTRAGLRTVQTIGVPGDDLALPEVDAVVLSLKSRSIPATDAVAMSRAAHAWLKSRGARHVMFKVCSTFDSTDAGNIGPVTDALREDAGTGPALVTPAFPINGRTVYMGHLFVGAMLLSDSPMKDHPLTPMRDSDLVRVLGRQSRSEIGLIDLATVAKGADAIAARLAMLQAKGCGAAVVDAVFDHDLEPIGLAALGGPLSVGASGLGLGLARAMISQGMLRSAAPEGGSIGAPVGGAVACLSGSCSQATLGQVAAAEAWGPVLRLAPDALLSDPGEIGRALDWAGARLGSGPVLIASSAPPDQVQAVQARFGREAAGHAVEQAMAAIAEGLVGRGVRRLIVAGGETSGAVVDRLGLPAFLVGPEIAPGVPVLRTAGQAGDEMLLALKSGNFGGPDFFADAIALMA